MIASSRYFAAILKPDFCEVTRKEIVFKDIDASTLKAVLDFIYSGCIEITLANISEIVAAASSMELIALGKKCGEIWAADLSVESCVDKFLTADKFRLTDLRSKALKFICEHFEDVPVEDIQQIDEKNLQDVLSNDEILAPETIVVDRLIQWITKNETEGKKIDSNLLKLVRLKHIPSTVSTVERTCLKFIFNQIYNGFSS